MDQQSTKEFIAKLESAQSYDEWLHTSRQLDEIERKEEWRLDDESEYYNSQALKKALTDLREARLEHNIPKLLYLVRTTFNRNVANMGDPRLYTYARSGTKYLIDEYINECELVLRIIVNDTDSTGPNIDDSDSDCAPDEVAALTPPGTPHRSMSPPPQLPKLDIKRQRERKKRLAEVLETLTETRKAFGRTALVFSGGSILGFLHAGVTKELANANLLPKIISGSSSGSIFASIFCTRTDEEFGKAWELLESPMNIFERQGEEESFMTHLKRFLTLGTWIDSSFLKELMQQLIGDITFREAFNRTGRVLNVTVSVAGAHDMPRLLNYLTAPNVVIWSAVVCSCSVPLVFASDSILAKDPKTKNIYPWSHGQFIDGSVDNDMPLSRLTEMFNINHFVACQVNPHIAPLFKDTEGPSQLICEPKQVKNTICDMKPSLLSYIGAPINWVQQKISNGIKMGQNIMFKEVEHSLTIIKESGLGSTAASVALNVMNQDYWGDINIVPSIKWKDVGHLFKNPTTEQVEDLVHRGQQATWSKIAIIRNHCAVELALDKAIYELNSRLISIVGAEHQRHQRKLVHKAHPQHIHQYHNLFHPKKKGGGSRSRSVANVGSPVRREKRSASVVSEE